MNTNDYYNEESGYEIEIWVETTKTLEEFEASLSHIIEPLVIEDHKFRLGGIECRVESVEDDVEVPQFAGVPSFKYSFCISLWKVSYLIWGAIDHHFAFALASGLRSQFSCHYLVTANGEFFLCQAGTNAPTYINMCYEPWASGEFVVYRSRGNRPTIELRIPPQNPYC